MIEHVVDLSASAIEVLAVVIIALAVTFGTVRFLLQWQGGRSDSYEHYKNHLGRALLLSLELLVAADIVRTVVLDQTLDSVLTLGVLVLVRTLLSWSVIVEIEGRWPWRAAELDAARNRATDRPTTRQSEA